MVAWWLGASMVLGDYGAGVYSWHRQWKLGRLGSLAVVMATKIVDVAPKGGLGQMVRARPRGGYGSGGVGPSPRLGAARPDARGETSRSGGGAAAAGLATGAAMMRGVDGALKGGLGWLVRR